MEIDNGLDNISSQLYIFSVGLGIVFIILGIILFFTNKGSKGKRSVWNCGINCFIIGIAVITSGLMHIGKM